MIPVTLLECKIVADQPLDLGANPGSSLRGALYEALAAMYDTGDPIRSRGDVETNPVAWLLRLEDEGISGGHDVPRPLALRPPRVAQGQELQFGLAFYGKGRETIPMVLSAVHAAGTLGIGRNRGRGAGRFRLASVHASDVLTRQITPILIDGKEVGALPPPPAAELYTRFAGLLRPDALTIQFVSPTRLIQAEHLYKQPMFRVWVQRLLERIRRVSALYAEAVWIPFNELLTLADSIMLVEDDTRWQEAWSYSRLEGTRKPTAGFVGRARYSGALEQLLPYLLVGQALQVGKNTIKGCGWYEIVYEWR
jgi:hypothetical protein